jgi:Domain of unknown function (DUF5666)
MQTPTSRRTAHRSWARLLGAGGTTVAAAAAVIAVMSAGGAAGAAAPPNLGATGSVAALNASSMEVQNANTGQTTVSWTGTTQFSKSVTESVSSLSPGSCVTVTGSASKKSKTTIAARSISVSSPTSTGSCNSFGTSTSFGTRTGGFPAGGGGGGFASRGPAGFPGGEASGTHTSFPSGGAGASNFRKQFASIDIASGKVTAVKGSDITVSGTSVSPGSFGGRTTKSGSETHSKTKKFTPPKTEKLTITTSSSTPVSATQSTTPSALAVGDCVSAFGPSASTGAVTATTVRITSTGGGSCTGGFGGGGGGGGGFFGRPGGGGQVSGGSGA